MRKIVKNWEKYKVVRKILFKKGVNKVRSRAFEGNPQPLKMGKEVYNGSLKVSKETQET